MQPPWSKNRESLQPRDGGGGVRQDANLVAARLWAKGPQKVCRPEVPETAIVGRCRPLACAAAITGAALKTGKLSDFCCAVAAAAAAAATESRVAAHRRGWKDKPQQIASRCMIAGKRSSGSCSRSHNRCDSASQRRPKHAAVLRLLHCAWLVLTHICAHNKHAVILKNTQDVTAELCGPGETNCL